MQVPAALGLEIYFYNALSYMIEALFEVGKLYTIICRFTAWLDAAYMLFTLLF